MICFNKLSPLCARTTPGTDHSLGTCTLGTLGISGVCCDSFDKVELPVRLGMAGAGEACAGSLEALNRFGRSVEGVDREANGLDFSEGDAAAGAFGASVEEVADGVKDGKLD